ncbi:hypothetical protein ACA910_002099 [Epithemia clementina (nom. ined.)]
MKLTDATKFSPKSPTTPRTPVYREDIQWDIITPKIKPIMGHARIAKRPPTPLVGAQPQLRRTKSLPVHLEMNKDHRSNNELSSKALFWFRPYPNRPFTPRGGSNGKFLSRTPSSSKRMLRDCRHRRTATLPDTRFLPKELELPTLHEEEPPMLQPDFLQQREDSYNPDVSSDDFDLRDDDDDDDGIYLSDDEMEDDILHGLSLLEERDE